MGYDGMIALGLRFDKGFVSLHPVSLALHDDTHCCHLDYIMKSCCSHHEGKYCQSANLGWKEKMFEILSMNEYQAVKKNT